MVDSIDYDFWRAQFSTPIGGGGGNGTTASGAGAKQSAPAAARLIADSSFVADVAVAAADANNSRAIAMVADSVFAQPRAGASERCVSQRGTVTTRRVATHQLPPDWSTLLSILADHKTRPNTAEASRSAGDNSAPIEEISSAESEFFTPILLCSATR